MIHCCSNKHSSFSAIIFDYTLIIEQTCRFPTYSITALEESGMLKVLKERNWPIDTCKIEQQGNMTVAHPMILRDMRAEFIILSVGILAATIALVLECFLAGCKRATCIPGLYTFLLYLSSRVLNKVQGGINGRNVAVNEPKVI